MEKSVSRSYPKWKYHPVEEAEIVQSSDEEKALGSDWHDSPADFGVERCPGRKPDLAVSKKKLAVK